MDAAVLEHPAPPAHGPASAQQRAAAGCCALVRPRRRTRRRSDGVGARSRGRTRCGSHVETRAWLALGRALASPAATAARVLPVARTAGPERGRHRAGDGMFGRVGEDAPVAGAAARCASNWRTGDEPRWTTGTRRARPLRRSARRGCSSSAVRMPCDVGTVNRLRLLRREALALAAAASRGRWLLPAGAVAAAALALVLAWRAPTDRRFRRPMRSSSKTWRRRNSPSEDEAELYAWLGEAPVAGDDAEGIGTLKRLAAAGALAVALILVPATAQGSAPGIRLPQAQVPEGVRVPAWDELSAAQRADLAELRANVGSHAAVASRRASSSATRAGSKPRRTGAADTARRARATSANCRRRNARRCAQPGGGARAACRTSSAACAQLWRAHDAASSAATGSTVAARAWRRRPEASGGESAPRVRRGRSWRPARRSSPASARLPCPATSDRKLNTLRAYISLACSAPMLARFSGPATVTPPVSMVSPGRVSFAVAARFPRRGRRSRCPASCRRPWRR